jgi:hypothetical protein
MIEVAVLVVFELLLLVVVLGTLREWRATRWERWLLPLPAFVLSMASCALPYEGDDLTRLPWLLGAIWLLAGLVLRAGVRRTYARLADGPANAEKSSSSGEGP